MGEGYHNNHHKHSSSPNFGGVRWHEIDVTYKIMQLLHFVRDHTSKTEPFGY